MKYILAVILFLSVHAHAVIYSEKVINTASNGPVLLIPAVPGKILHIWGYFVQAAGTTTTYFTGDGIAKSGPVSLPANWHISAVGDNGAPTFTLNIITGFYIVQTGAVQLSGVIWYSWDTQ